jgi:uncharacterized protein YecE (DUF72 family)
VRPVRIGCSGWNYPHWRERVYAKGLPQRRWLEHYATLFDTVEINNTFYRLPRREAVAAWVAESPPGFVFAVKASRYLTHVKRLMDMGQGVARFYERIEPLARSPKMGPVLWQLPPTFRRDDERLAGALAALPPGRHCFEFRHESWFVPEVEQILRLHGSAMVIGVDPSRPFQTLSRTAEWMYIRFHRGRGSEGNFTGRQLEEWAERVAEWLQAGDVYAYFNDDWGGYALREAMDLRRLLGTD